MVFADNPAEEPVWVTMTADKSQVAPGEEITLTMSIDQTVENAYIWQWNIIWNKDLFDQVEMKRRRLCTQYSQYKCNFPAT